MLRLLRNRHSRMDHSPQRPIEPFHALPAPYPRKEPVEESNSFPGDVQGAADSTSFYTFDDDAVGWVGEGIEVVAEGEVADYVYAETLAEGRHVHDFVAAAGVEELSEEDICLIGHGWFEDFQRAVGYHWGNDLSFLAMDIAI